MKLTLMKFFVGGFAVLLSYIVSVTLPWKEFGGIFATFPAVFLVSMFITGMQYGDKVAVHVSRGAVFGMTGVLVCILVTWMMLHMTHMWLITVGNDTFNLNGFNITIAIFFNMSNDVIFVFQTK